MFEEAVTKINKKLALRDAIARANKAIEMSRAGSRGQDDNGMLLEDQASAA